MLKELCHQLAELKKKVDLETWERSERKNKPDYIALTEQISKLMAGQDAMLATIPDSSEAYAKLHSQVLAEMEKQNVYAVGSVQGKFRESKTVNKEAVFRVLQGDIDQFVSMAEISQVSLKNFAAGHHDMKKPLLDCIEVTEKKLVDLSFDFSLPA